MGYWYISRLREKTTYRILHTYYRHEGILDAVVWLGSSHGARAGHAVRLVRFHDGHGLRTYLTNVLDPRQLSMVEIAQLYARRWDIELAFLTLKEHLGLHHWWSSQPTLILQQIWAVLIIAQVLQALRLEIAAAAQVEAFEVSLPLLVKYVPQLIRQHIHPLAWVLTYGKPLELIRPASRLQVWLRSLLSNTCFCCLPSSSWCARPVTSSTNLVLPVLPPTRSTRKKPNPVSDSMYDLVGVNALAGTLLKRYNALQVTGKDKERICRVN